MLRLSEEFCGVCSVLIVHIWRICPSWKKYIVLLYYCIYLLYKVSYIIL